MNCPKQINKRHQFGSQWYFQLFKASLRVASNFQPKWWNQRLEIYPNPPKAWLDLNTPYGCNIIIYNTPSREFTYPTLGKGKSSSKSDFWWDMLVPWRVSLFFNFCVSLNLPNDEFCHLLLILMIPWIPWSYQRPATVDHYTIYLN